VSLPACPAFVSFRGTAYLKDNISMLVTGNDSRNLSAECRLAAGAGLARLQRILNENIGEPPLFHFRGSI